MNGRKAKREEKNIIFQQNARGKKVWKYLIRRFSERTQHNGLDWKFGFESTTIRNTPRERKNLLECLLTEQKMVNDQF